MHYVPIKRVYYDRMNDIRVSAFQLVADMLPKDKRDPTLLLDADEEHVLILSLYYKGYSIQPLASSQAFLSPQGLRKLPKGFLGSWLIHYGPRTSYYLLTNEGLEKSVAEKIYVFLGEKHWYPSTQDSW